MDYFNELLESYALLKKRTFKLRYLSEQEQLGGSLTEVCPDAAADPRALEMARNLIANPEPAPAGGMAASQDSIKRTVRKSQTPYAYINKENETVVSYVGFGGQGDLRTVPGGQFESMNVDDQCALLGYFIDGAASDAAGESPASPESFAQAELAGTIFDLGDIKQRLHKIYTHYVKLCETLETKKQQKGKSSTPLTAGAVQGIERDCYRSAFSKVYGRTTGGLAGLMTSTKVNWSEIDPDAGDKEITLTEEASPMLVIAALSNIEFLLDYALHPEKDEYANSEDLCQQFSDKFATTSEHAKNKTMGKGGADRILIYGINKEEGILIPGTSKDFQHALTRAKNHCQDDKGVYEDGKPLFEDFDFRALSDAAINAKKGTLHERLSGLLVDLHNLVGLDAGAERKAVHKEFIDALENAGKVTDYLVGEILSDEGSRVASIDEAIANQLGLDEHELFKEDPNVEGDERRPELKKFLIDYYKGMQKFLDKVKPAVLIHNGLASTTGGRQDQFMVFKDQAGADRAAEVLGTATYPMDRKEFIKNSENPKITERKLKAAGVKGDTVHVIGMGQKIYAELKGGKIGEINSVTRLCDLVTQETKEGKDDNGNQIYKATNKKGQEDDKHLDNGFFDKVNEMFPLSDAGRDDLRELRAELDLLEDYIVNDKEWQMLGPDGKPTGQVKTMDSNATAKSVVKQILEGMGWEALNNTELGKLCKGYKGTALDRQALSVELQRQQLSRKWDKMSKTATGKQALLRMAFTIGGNATEMTQSIFVQDGRKHYAIRHNAIFDKFKAAQEANPPTLKITVKGHTVTFDDGNGFVGSMKNERTSSKGKATQNVRTQFDISKGTIEKLDQERKKDDPHHENAETLTRFLRGQMQLLETLLN